MKIRKTGLLLLVCMALSACGTARESGPGQPGEAQVSQAGPNQGEKDREPQEDDQTQTDSQEMNHTDEIPLERSIRELTQEELQQFTDFINIDDNCGNYGFLSSVYEKPEDVYLDEVFYTGAGIASVPETEEEKQAYLEASQQTEVYTDLLRISRPEADAFLVEKTGVGYDDMNKPLTWLYLGEYDAFYAEHGDTNYRTYTCIGGNVWEEEDIFTLRFSPDEDNWEYYHSFDCETVLQKKGDSYQFVSNRLITEDGLIEEQSFTFDMGKWGEVTFAAYEPDTGKNPMADATYLIMHDGIPLVQLQGTDMSNLAQSPFREIKAVAFRDYNEDGITDIIILAEYGEGDIQSRVYTGNSYGYFALSQVLYGPETVGGVMEELGTN